MLFIVAPGKIGYLRKAAMILLMPVRMMMRFGVMQVTILSWGRVEMMC